MPPREARAVFFQREYFSDHEFQTALTAEERELYLALAQLADDEGWLLWSNEIAWYVYRFRDAPLADLKRNVAGLITTHRVRIYACGHAQLLRWGAKRRHVGRPDAPDRREAEAHRAHRKRSGNVSGTLRKLDALPGDISGNSATPSIPFHSLQPTGAPARVRGGTPERVGDMSEFRKRVPRPS